MLKLRRLPYIFTIGMIVMSMAGCSSKNGDRPKTVHASGVVRYKGAPLAGAHVTFTNAAANVSAYARTDADGKFTLTTFEHGDGAVPGPQKVSVSKVETIGGRKADDRTDTLEKSEEPQKRWVIPEHYGSVDTSGLTAEIVENGKNEIVLELQEDRN